MEPQKKTEAEILEEIRSTMQTVKTDVGTLRTNDTERATKLTAIEGRLTTLEERALKGVSLPGVEDEFDRFSLARAFRGIILEARPEITNKDEAWKGAEMEREVFQQVRKRTQGTEVDISGGYTLPIEFASRFIELMYAKTALDKAGVTKISGLRGATRINGLASGATAYWHGEGKKVTESDPTWLQKSLRPHEMTSWLKIQNQLIMRSTEAIETRMREVLARAVALKLDLAGLLGSGGEYQPQGLHGTTGVLDLDLGANGARFGFENIPDIEELLETALHSPDGMKIITNHKVKKWLKKQRIAQFSGDTGGQFVIWPMSDAMLADALGYGLLTSQQIPTNLAKGSGTNLTYVWAGLWREMVMADWGTLSFSASGEASDGTNSAWLENQTWLKVNGAFDFGFFYPNAFTESDEAATT